MTNQLQSGNAAGRKRRWPLLVLLIAIALIGMVTVVIAAGAGIRILSNPSSGNAPTLRVGDYFTANTSAYDNDDPLRGDLVVFALPGNESVQFVKRVIGLPGEKVQIKDGAVFINGIAVPRARLKDYSDGQGKTVQQFSETLPNGLSHPTLDLSPVGPADNTPVYDIPDGHYFVLGDNRDNSTDSRFPAVGLVPRKNILARAGMVLFASDLSRIGTMLDLR